MTIKSIKIMNLAKLGILAAMNIEVFKFCRFVGFQPLWNWPDSRRCRLTELWVAIFFATTKGSF
jgi:hypothetical protein